MGILNSLNPPVHSYLAEVLLAGQELILGIHEGDAAAMAAHAAYIDIALGERADDDGRLVAGRVILSKRHTRPLRLPGDLIIYPI